LRTRSSCALGRLANRLAPDGITERADQEAEMYVRINGCRLFFDVEGAKLVIDGPRMREKPTVVLVHGGPGHDHSIYKPEFGTLADAAQLIYYDQRGHGRSDPASPAAWTLAQWADDLKALCEHLGIDRPIVVGTSFGGFVAQTYASRYPHHPSALILISTATRLDAGAAVSIFARRGGTLARSIAARFFREPCEDAALEFVKICVPLFRARSAAALSDETNRTILRTPVMTHFVKPDGEYHRMDLRSCLARVTCPTLVLGGEQDPITPIELSEELADALGSKVVRFERLPDCGHPVFKDDPNRALALIRDFMQSIVANGAASGGTDG
jgi:pimeloyl-ACP methyl ester carboxylesterase